MAVPAIVVKVIDTAATSKKGRNVLAVLIAAILSIIDNFIVFIFGS